MKNKKISVILIIIGLIISCIYNFIIIEKFDKNFIGSDGFIQHYIIKGDTKNYFEEANIIKNQLENNKNFFETGSEYKLSFLYPRLLALFFYSTNEKIKKKSNETDFFDVFNINNKKLVFLFLQSIFYYFCVFIFYKKVNKKINLKLLNVLIFFLCFEPTILQFHSHFLTESIYLGFLVLLLSFLIDYKNDYKQHIFIGIVIGIMYLQRTVALFLIFPIIVYYFIYLKRFNILFKSIFLIIIGQIIILIFLGYCNYQRSGIFYTTPHQAKHIMWYYLTDNIVSASSKNNISYEKTIRLKDEKQWIKDNNINTNYEKDRLKLYNYHQKYIFKTFKDHPFESLRIISWKTLQSSILDPGMVYSLIKSDYSKQKYWEDGFFNIKEKIIYSFFIYILSIIGIFYFLKKKDYLIPSLLIMFGLYHIIILGWAGASRYSVPSVICISFLFAQGIIFVISYFQKKVIHSKFSNKDK